MVVVRDGNRAGLAKPRLAPPHATPRQALDWGGGGPGCFFPYLNFLYFYVFTFSKFQVVISKE